MSFTMENKYKLKPEKNNMLKRIISICTIGILVFGIYGCAQTVENTLGTETEIVEPDYTETEGEEEQDEEVILEISEDIGDCKWVYNSWMEFDDEGQLPYASEETFRFIKAAYDEVDYIGQFKKGDLALYDDYKEKYKRLIQNEVPFYDKESSKEVYINGIPLVFFRWLQRMNILMK